MFLEVFTSKFLPAKNKLYRFAYFFLKDEDEASDVVQEVLLKAWDRRASWHQVGNVEAWCMTLTRNLALDRLKAAGRHTDSLDAAMWLTSGGESPHDVTERSDDLRMMRQLVARLPEKQQEVLRLRDIEGFTYDEISDMMGIDLSQVKVNLHRARKFLKESLLKINDYGLEATGKATS